MHRAPEAGDEPVGRVAARTRLTAHDLQLRSPPIDRAGSAGGAATDPQSDLPAGRGLRSDGRDRITPDGRVRPRTIRSRYGVAIGKQRRGTLPGPLTRCRLIGPGPRSPPQVYRGSATPRRLRRITQPSTPGRSPRARRRRPRAPVFRGRRTRRSRTRRARTRRQRSPRAAAGPAAHRAYPPIGRRTPAREARLGMFALVACQRCVPRMTAAELPRSGWFADRRR
jgi:hypothetical protein